MFVFPCSIYLFLVVYCFVVFFVFAAVRPRPLFSYELELISAMPSYLCFVLCFFVWRRGTTSSFGSAGRIIAPEDHCAGGSLQQRITAAEDHTGGSLHQIITAPEDNVAKPHLLILVPDRTTAFKAKDPCQRKDSRPMPKRTPDPCPCQRGLPDPCQRKDSRREDSRPMPKKGPTTHAKKMTHDDVQRDDSRRYPVIRSNLGSSLTK